MTRLLPHPLLPPRPLYHWACLPLLLLLLHLPPRQVQATQEAAWSPSNISLPVAPSPPPAPTIISTTTTISTTPPHHNNTKLTAQVGTTAVLHCSPQNVDDNMVSWIRRRDYHLLTVGRVVYSSDDRFQVSYVQKRNDWQLHIRYVQPRDAGIYECQVSSHPPVSIMATLHVLEATSEILGGPEKYVRVGSSLRLVCVFKDVTEPPMYVFWYHHDHMINYLATRQVRVENSKSMSVLHLSDVQPGDSGNYTCGPSNIRPAHITIHVLKGGETPQAIHSGAPVKGGPSTPCLVMVLLSLIVPLSLMVSLPPHTPSLLMRTTTTRSKVGEDGEGRERTTTYHHNNYHNHLPPPQPPQPSLPLNHNKDRWWW